MDSVKSTFSVTFFHFNKYARIEYYTVDKIPIFLYLLLDVLFIMPHNLLPYIAPFVIVSEKTDNDKDC